MMHRIFIAILPALLLFAPFAEAQQTWSKLTPKQKIKIAKKEQREARKDPEYLKLMEEGKMFFRQKEYDKALEKYNEAHNRRPNNVYPLVMMEDIEAARGLITGESRPETLPEAVPPQKEIVQPEIIPAEIPAEKPDAGEVNENKEEMKKPEQENKGEIVDKTPENIEKEISREQKQMTEEKQPPTVEKPEVPEPVKYKNDGVYRETLKEGNATVYQVTVVSKGVATVIRKVVHPWGAVYYFKDKSDITRQEYEKLLEWAKSHE